MTEGVVESKEEMKKKMEKMKKDKAEKESPDITKEAKEKLKGTKEQTEEKLKGAKEQTEEKLKGAKEQTGEKLGDVKGNLGDVKDDTYARFEQFRRESEREGRNPAEKFLSEIFSGFLQKTEDVNEAMTERGITLTNQPLTDVIETDDAITIIVDIPGLTKENIEIGMSQKSVEITATYKEQPPLTNAKFIQKERGYGVVHRDIDLTTPIDIEKATANYKNCILTITLPKKQKELTKITIQE